MGEEYYSEDRIPLDLVGRVGKSSGNWQNVMDLIARPKGDSAEENASLPVWLEPRSRSNRPVFSRNHEIREPPPNETPALT